MMSEEWSNSFTTSAFTLLALVLAAYALLRRRLPAPERPGNLQAEGSVSLKASDFGDKDEIHRDCQRAINAKGVLVLGAGAAAPAPLVLRREEGCTWQRALASTLTSLDGASDAEPLTEEVLARLLPMLTVGPALSVLLAAHCVPSLQHHRFVIVLYPGGLRTHTLGFVGMPGGSHRHGVWRHELTGRREWRLARLASRRRAAELRPSCGGSSWGARCPCEHTR